MSQFTEAPEAPRDQVEGPFTFILRRLRLGAGNVLAAVFVDREGEGIDYSSLIDVFDAKIAGAALVPAVRMVREAVVKLAGGELQELVVRGTERDLVVRRMDEEFALVLICRGGTADDAMISAIDEAIDELRREAGFEAPVWDDSQGPLEVEVRSAVGWDYAPIAFRHCSMTVAVTDVLGRWEETGGVVGGSMICFRVHTDRLEEVTLAYDPRVDRWYEWQH